MMNAGWPFADPENLLVVTTRSVIQRGIPILLVQHLAKNEGWTFLDGKLVDLAHGLLITFRKVVALDPSIKELADLPEGWLAKRDRPGAPWIRERDVE